MVKGLGGTLEVLYWAYGSDDFFIVADVPDGASAIATSLIVTLIGGGNWAQPNNPALSPVIMATYYVGMLLTLIWLVWTGLALLRRKA